MGMQFRVRVTGDLRCDDVDIQLDYRFDAEQALRDHALDFSGGIEDAEVESASAIISASVSAVTDVDVADMEGFDAHGFLNEELGWSGDISHAEYEVIEGPTGFDVVEEAVGRDTAISVYSVLSQHGYEVS